MVRKGLFFMLLFIGIVHFSLGEEINPKEKDFYITPRIGFSTLTGLIGIELQYKHVAFDIGYAIDDEPPHEGEDIHHYLMYGIKYYVNSHHSTWYIGLGGWANLDKDELDIGVILGYRWRWGKGWDFSLGYGLVLSRLNDVSPPPMFELAFGYSF